MWDSPGESCEAALGGQRLIAELETTPITRRLPSFKALITVVLEIPASVARNHGSRKLINNVAIAISET